MQFAWCVPGILPCPAVSWAVAILIALQGAVEHPAKRAAGSQDCCSVCRAFCNHTLEHLLQRSLCFGLQVSDLFWKKVQVNALQHSLLCLGSCLPRQCMAHVSCRSVSMCIAHVTLCEVTGAQLLQSDYSSAYVIHLCMTGSFGTVDLSACVSNVHVTVCVVTGAKPSQSSDSSAGGPLPVGVCHLCPTNPPRCCCCCCCCTTAFAATLCADFSEAAEPCTAPRHSRPNACCCFPGC